MQFDFTYILGGNLELKVTARYSDPEPDNYADDDMEIVDVKFKQYSSNGLPSYTDFEIDGIGQRLRHLGPYNSLESFMIEAAYEALPAAIEEQDND